MLVFTICAVAVFVAIKISCDFFKDLKNHELLLIAFLNIRFLLELVTAQRKLRYCLNITEELSNFSRINKRFYELLFYFTILLTF